jgi:glycosyltransferase involved in cell wall biosynthesis
MNINAEKNTVTIIIPIYNEEKVIRNCILSVLNQSYPQELMELLLIDGCSTDNTLQIINDFVDAYPDFIKVLINNEKTVPYAMNMGISQAGGWFIIRLDAHAEYPPDYISKCICLLANTNADNVGGLWRTVGKGYIGEAIALLLSSSFGVGNSQYRVNGKSGYVDTVPFGAFRREVFVQLGGFDTRLTRNQDYEMNYRIRKNRGKIFLSSDIHCIYYCRNTIKDFSIMGFVNGKWNIITMFLCPGSMGIRHFIPLLFNVTIIGLSILSVIQPVFRRILLCELLLYFTADLIFSIRQSFRSWKYFPVLFFLYPIFHFSYGFGSLISLLTFRHKNWQFK